MLVSPRGVGAATVQVDVHHVGAGRCLVWDAAGAETLRREHRLVGCLLGSFPQHKQQNLFYTLPMQLMPEEVSLALKRGWIRLLDDSLPYAEPQEDAKAAHEQGKREAQAQREKERAEHRAQEIHYWEQQAQKRKRPMSGEDASAAEPRPPGEPPTTVTSKSAAELECSGNATQDEGRARSSPLPARAPVPHGAGLVVPLTARDVGGRPWQRDERLISLEEWRRSLFPRDDERAGRREAVFEDLWKRSPNCYISSGLKFGGDFLVYPGDPLMYHATYIVVVVGWDEPLAPLDLVAVGRTAVGVKKSTVFASVRGCQSGQVDADKDATEEALKVTYLTIDWRGVT